MAALSAARESLVTFSDKRYWFLAWLLLIWPARPCTIVSCKRTGSSFRAPYLFLFPTAHKRKPMDVIYKVKVQDKTLHTFFEAYFKEARHTYLFSDTAATPTGLVKTAF